MAEHPNDPNRPEVPNTSRSAPSSHVDPGRFFWNHRPVVWWIMGGLGLFVVIGLGAALITQLNTDTTESQGEPPVAEARPTEGSSAVAGQGSGKSITVSVKDGDFEPASASVPRGGNAVFAVVEGTCHLAVNGDEKAILFTGQDYEFDASTPGEYEIKCNESDNAGIKVLVP